MRHVNHRVARPRLYTLTLALSHEWERGLHFMHRGQCRPEAVMTGSENLCRVTVLRT